MYGRGRLNLYKKGRIGAADLHLKLNRDQKAILHTVGGPDEVAQRGRNTMQQRFLCVGRCNGPDSTVMMTETMVKGRIFHIYQRAS